VPATLSPAIGVSPDGRTLVVSLSASPEEIWSVEIKE